jgi:hypothetical protein
MYITAEAMLALIHDVNDIAQRLAVVAATIDAALNADPSPFDRDGTASDSTQLRSVPPL